MCMTLLNEGHNLLRMFTGLMHPQLALFTAGVRIMCLWISFCYILLVHKTLKSMYKDRLFFSEPLAGVGLSHICQDVSFNIKMFLFLM